MSYPNRITRVQLGPELEDVKPVVDPKKFIGAATWNLLFWQVAGTNLVVPRGVIVAEIDVSNTTATTVYQALAWDPDGTVPTLSWTYVSDQEWTLTFSETKYPDHSGQDVTLVLEHVAPDGGYESDGTPLDVRAGKTAARALKVTTASAVSDGARVGVRVY